jgi:signal peptidase I
MEPVINKNDVVIFRKTNVANLEEGTIIIYLRNERLEVSRITAIRENRGITSYIIKGDNIYHIEEILGNNVQGEVVRIISNGIGLNILRAFGSKVITIIIAIYILLLVRYKRRRGHRLRS